MAKFVIIATIASSSVTYLYDDPAKAWSKVRTLQRSAKPHEIRDGATNQPLSADALRDLADNRSDRKSA